MQPSQARWQCAPAATRSCSGGPTDHCCCDLRAVFLCAVIRRKSLGYENLAAFCGLCRRYRSLATGSLRSYGQTSVSVRLLSLPRFRGSVRFDARVNPILSQFDSDCRKFWCFLWHILHHVAGTVDRPNKSNAIGCNKMLPDTTGKDA